MSALAIQGVVAQAPQTQHPRFGILANKMTETLERLPDTGYGKIFLERKQLPTMSLAQMLKGLEDTQTKLNEAERRPIDPKAMPDRQQATLQRHRWEQPLRDTLYGYEAMIGHRLVEAGLNHGIWPSGHGDHNRTLTDMEEQLQRASYFISEQSPIAAGLSLGKYLDSLA